MCRVVIGQLMALVILSVNVVLPEPDPPAIPIMYTMIPPVLTVMVTYQEVLKKVSTYVPYGNSFMGFPIVWPSSGQ
jgi:hypothetical protein